MDIDGAHKAALKDLAVGRHRTLPQAWDLGRWVGDGLHKGLGCGRIYLDFCVFVGVLGHFGNKTIGAGCDKLGGKYRDLIQLDSP